MKARLLAEHPEVRAAPNPMEAVTHHMSAYWKSLPDSSKQKWIECAQQDAHRYQQEMSVFQQSQAYSEFMQQIDSKVSEPAPNSRAAVRALISRRQHLVFLSDPIL